MKIDYLGVRLLPKQWEFVFSDVDPWILYSGAVGAGKSRALCYRAARLASLHPAMRVGLTRKTLAALKDTTITTMLERDGDLPAVLPSGTFTYQTTKQGLRIKLHGGGTILPFGCDNPERIGSFNLTDLCIDEGIELDKPEWNMLDARCRVQVTIDGALHPNTVATATNPGPPTHFMYELFYPPGKPGRRLIQTSTVENWFLPRGFVSRLASHYEGPARKRYLLGLWCAMEGMVYPMFDSDCHVVHEPGPWAFYVAGVDYGFTHRSAVRVWGVRKRAIAPRIHCVAEFYRTGATSPELTDTCYEASIAYPGTRFVVDQNAPDLIKQMKQRGLNAVAGRSGPGDVLPGIRQVSACLADVMPETATRRCTFEPGLEGTDEYFSYSWNPKSAKEEPIKKNDDAVDADRYALVNIHEHLGVRRLSVIGQPTPEPIDDFCEAANITHLPNEPDRLTDPRFWEPIGSF